MYLENNKEAKAYIKGGENYPDIRGIVDFKELQNGVIVTAEISGLPKNETGCKGRFFGMHIHEGTSCTGNEEDEFADAKMHYNPTNCEHPYHVGDLPPLLENNGYAFMKVLVNKIGNNKIKGYCHVPWTDITFSYHGSLSCDNLCEFFGNPLFILKKDNMHEYWNSSLIQKLRKKIIKIGCCNINCPKANVKNI